jgi:predicted nucleic acid-binding Zn ribbon protein
VSPHRLGPRPLAPAIDAIRSDLAPRTLLADAQRAWPDAVGPAIAAEASPTAERAGVLTVSCSASVWAQELDLLSEAILERLNAELRSGRIARLRCIATPPFRASI